MKKAVNTWLIATISTSVGIALGMLLKPGKKSSKNGARHPNNDAGAGQTVKN